MIAYKIFICHLYLYGPYEYSYDNTNIYMVPYEFILFICYHIIIYMLPYKYLYEISYLYGHINVFLLVHVSISIARGNEGLRPPGLAHLVPY